MMFFLSYLKMRRWEIALFGVMMLLFAAVFFFSSLPLAALIYPGLLCALVLLAAMAVDYGKRRKKHKELLALMELPAEMIRDLPLTEDPLERDYQQLTGHICQQVRQMASQSDEKQKQFAEYYTLWAHQIKTPIAAMGLMLQNEDTALSRRLTAELARVERYADMVMVYLRLDSPSSDYQFMAYSTDEMIRTAVKKFTHEFILRRVHLVYEPTEYTMLTDEKWLGVVLEQLLSNALKYTPSGGTVTIGQEDSHSLFIADTGIGIAQEDLPRIFEMGFTGKNGRVQRQASGIGLYLCQRICQRLNIRIQARSVPGEGTTMTLSWQEPDEDLTKM